VFGIGSSATLHIVDSVLSGNLGVTGGAIGNYVGFNSGNAILQITHGVLSSNRADNGAGIANVVLGESGTASVQIASSILSGNWPGGAIRSINLHGMGFTSAASVEIRDSTLSRNGSFLNKGGGDVYNV